jgi:Ca2+-binding RTX toxin-like protein
MAKMKYTIDAPEYINAFSTFLSGTVITHGRKSVTFIDSDGEEILVLDGKGFKYSGDFLIGGTVTSMSLTDPNGVLWNIVSGLHFDAASLPTSSPVWPANVLSKMLKNEDVLIGSGQRDQMRGYGGNDVLRGMDGSDALSGGKGRDRLTGGLGADLFVLDRGDGDDVITDFESAGPLELHDKLVSSADSFELRKAGRDLLVEFDDGNSFRLLDFKKSQFDTQDVTFM